MINNNIKEYCETQGNEISKILLKLYSKTDFDINPESIEKEIYDIAISYAKIFIFETQSYLNERDREEFRVLINFRFNTTQKVVNKMSDIELIAHGIKLNTIDSLKDSGIILI